MQIPAGYKTITPIQFSNAVWALSEGLIGGHEFRVYLACFELTAIREAAKRPREKRREQPKDLARYRLVELETLTAPWCEGARPDRRWRAASSHHACALPRGLRQRPRGRAGATRS